MIKRKLASMSLLLLAALPAAAGERVLTLDPESSSVRFTLDATMHKVHGTFEVARGTVTFDAVPGPASGEIVVNAVSAETGNEGRDEKMHGEVLLSARHPEITFVPRQLEGELPEGGEGSLKVAGVMRILGSDHPVTLPLNVVVDGTSVRITSTFQVPYVTWGLDDPSVFLLRVGKEVDVEVEASGTLATTAEPAEPDGDVSATP